MRSMMCAPPMMVRTSDACPGQSTRVTWRPSTSCRLEKPRSRVIPRLWLCGFLSKAAVDPCVLMALAAAEEEEMGKKIKKKVNVQRKMTKRRWMYQETSCHYRRDLGSRHWYSWSSRRREQVLGMGSRPINFSSPSLLFSALCGVDKWLTQQVIGLLVYSEMEENKKNFQ